MASSLVIKVKYGDTLRRFNAIVKEDQQLQLNMEGLRVKVRSLFNFTPDVDFTLTYIDEDDDNVTLVDDEDLTDLLSQGLNPVRITVHLDASKDASSVAPSSENSTSNRSSSQTNPRNINSNVADVLNSVPEPLRDAFSKLSLELASRVSSTSPVVADLVDNLSKIGQSYLNASHPHAGTTSSSLNEVHDNVFPSNTASDEGMKFSGIGSPEPRSKSSQAQNVVEVVKGVEPMRSPSHPSFLLQKGKKTGKFGVNKDGNLLKPKLFGDHKRKDKIIGESSAKSGVKMPVLLNPTLEKHASCPSGTTETADGRNRKFKFNFGGTSSSSNCDLALEGECPFGWIPLPRYDDGVPPLIPISSGNCNDNADGMGSIFHKGVRCDGCGVLPITGPRFKSKVKHDFDLCNVCFTIMGNEAEYTRINFPLSFRHPISKGFYDPMVTHPNSSPHLAMRRPCTLHHLRSKLDSRFIMDVNVMDGTMMAPSTPFTKIWRMRNIGSIPWSCGLQFVWIGGDRFSASDSAEIEIPRNGVNIGGELDIAVDFVAPELPGRYISYWRMAGPSGHKFGQRVWVLIQVDASSKGSTCESSMGLNLNLVPESCGTESPAVYVEPSLCDQTGDLNAIACEIENSSVEQNHKIEIGDLNFPINDDLLVGSDASCAASVAASSSASSPACAASVAASSSASPAVCANPKLPVTSPPSYLEVDVNNHPASTPSSSYPTIDVGNMVNTSNIEDANTSSVEVREDDKRNPESNKEKNEVEQNLLKELEQMGFKQVDLNKEVLRMNEYDLERSVDELCGVSEWDPILVELQEMGFHDKETNKKLLAKNNGSIMRVVMDLVAGENV